MGPYSSGCVVLTRSWAAMKVRMKAWFGTCPGIRLVTCLYQAVTIAARNHQNLNFIAEILQVYDLNYLTNKSNRRFWTRSRPGDTNVDKTDESSMSNRANEKVTGIIFRNIELTGKWIWKILITWYLYQLLTCLLF